MYRKYYLTLLLSVLKEIIMTGYSYLNKMCLVELTISIGRRFNIRRKEFGVNKLYNILKIKNKVTKI